MQKGRQGGWWPPNQARQLPAVPKTFQGVGQGAGSRPTSPASSRWAMVKQIVNIPVRFVMRLPIGSPTVVMIPIYLGISTRSADFPKACGARRRFQWHSGPKDYLGLHGISRASVHRGKQRPSENLRAPSLSRIRLCFSNEQRSSACDALGSGRSLQYSLLASKDASLD